MADMSAPFITREDKNMYSMDRFRDFQQLVSGFSDTEWLVDCAVMPSINMRQAQIDTILLEIIRRETA